MCHSYGQDGKEELDKLLRFLDIDLDDMLKSDIIDMCGFEKMQKDKGKDKMGEMNLRKDFKFFRKGIIIIKLLLSFYVKVKDTL